MRRVIPVHIEIRYFIVIEIDKKEKNEVIKLNDCAKLGMRSISEILVELRTIITYHARLSEAHNGSRIANIRVKIHYRTIIKNNQPLELLTHTRYSFYPIWLNQWPNERSSKELFQLSIMKQIRTDLLA